MLFSRCSCEPLDTAVNMTLSDGYDPLPSSNENTHNHSTHSSYAAIQVQQQQQAKKEREYISRWLLKLVKLAQVYFLGN